MIKWELPNEASFSNVEQLFACHYGQTYVQLAVFERKWSR